MKKNNKIRSKVVKESLLDYNNLANTLKENTTAAVKDLLSEAVRDTYSKILKESDDDEDDDKDYDVEEVEDTDSGTNVDDTDDLADDTDDSDVEGSDDADDTDTDDDIDTDTDDDDDTDVTTDSGIDDNGDLTGETTANGEDEDGDEWSEFDKYKVSDGEYDLSNAKDDEIVKVYKLLNNDDQVVVNKTDDNKYSIKDNETGAEYLLDLGDDTDTAMAEESDDFGDDDDYIASDYAEDGMDYNPDEDDEEEDDMDYDSDEDEEEDDTDNDMNESRIYEIAINEYDSNLGYTDNYQNKDAMQSMKVADDKDADDWGSKGLRSRGNQKPWSGKKNSASENQPFTAAKGKTVEKEDGTVDAGAEADDSTVTESAGEMGAKMGAHARMMGTKFHANNNRTKLPYVKHHVSRAGEYVGDEDGTEATNESIRRKANKIFTENKELKNALSKFKNVLKEAAVTNVNLGQIIKLISENTTSQDEKREIIARFGKEAKTVEQSKSLYESISRDLQKKGKLNINEDKQFGATGSKQINETQIYQSQDLLESLDLMHKICK